MAKTEILIIDDEVQIRKLLEITLGSNGYLVRQAATAKQGTIQAANHPPDLIILDLCNVDLHTGEKTLAPE